MRIISQDRKMNLSLDLIHLSTGKSRESWIIYARDRFDGDAVAIGMYSSEEKCESVFEYIVWCISSDGNSDTVIYLPKDEEV